LLKKENPPSKRGWEKIAMKKKITIDKSIVISNI
jgi:hypothetical protein